MTIPAQKVMRLLGLIRKEFSQILRDPSSIAIAFVLPVVLLLIFGYGVSLDAKHIRIGLVQEQPDGETNSFASGFEQSEYFTPTRFATMAEAETALLSGCLDGILVLQADFGSRILDGTGSPVQLVVNGVDANTARIIQGYVDGVSLAWIQQRASSLGADHPFPVDMQGRIWFNSDLRSRDYLVPGLIAVIMTLTGTLLTAMVMAREWERGTMEALLVTPASAREILMGKLVPYFVLAMGGMLLSVAMAIWLFHVPLRGSFFVLLASSSLYLLAALGLGLIISIVSKNQFVAGQAAIIATFLPAFMLSGFIFDLRSTPEPIQWLTYVFAARYFVSILQTVFLAGDVWEIIIPNSMALLAMAVVFLGISTRRFHKRLD